MKMKGRDDGKEAGGQTVARSGFIFTTDAFLVLPLVILIVTAFMAFSVSLRENMFFHEYTYTIARDRLAYLSDLPYGDSGLSVLGAITNASLNGNDAAARSVAEAYIDVPAGAGYVLERLDAGTGTWIEIANKSVAAYKYSASAVRISTVLAEPYLDIDGQRVGMEAGAVADYLEGYDCAKKISCSIPSSIYVRGEVVGPAMIRLRVQM